MTDKERFEKWAEIHEWFKKDDHKYITPAGEIITVSYLHDGEISAIFNSKDS